MSVEAVSTENKRVDSGLQARADALLSQISSVQDKAGLDSIKAEIGALKAEAKGSGVSVDFSAVEAALSEKIAEISNAEKGKSDGQKPTLEQELAKEREEITKETKAIEEDVDKLCSKYDQDLEEYRRKCAAVEKKLELGQHVSDEEMAEIKKGPPVFNAEKESSRISAHNERIDKNIQEAEKRRNGSSSAEEKEKLDKHMELLKAQKEGLRKMNSQINDLDQKRGYINERAENLSERIKKQKQVSNNFKKALEKKDQYSKAHIDSDTFAQAAKIKYNLNNKKIQQVQNNIPFRQQEQKSSIGR